MSEVSFSVVVPIYNERESAPVLAAELSEVLEKIGGAWECIWVNDGSTDDTEMVMCEYVRENPEHRIITLTDNFGQSAALAAGIKEARGGVIGVLDGDSQNDPADFPQLLERLKRGDVDIVNGFRANRKDDLVKLLSSRIANKFRRLFTGDAISDIGCAIRVFKRECSVGLPVFKAYHRFLPVLMSMRGWRMCEIPVNHRPRARGMSKYGVGNRLWVGLADTCAVCWMKKRLVWPEIKE